MKIFLSVFILFFLFGCITPLPDYSRNTKPAPQDNNTQSTYEQTLAPEPEQAEKTMGELLAEKIAPTSGVTLSAKWGDVLAKTVEAGAIDINKYNANLAQYGKKLTKEHEKILLEGSDENITFTRENALFNLNMLWALGLVNDNPILAEGKISQYGEKKRYLAAIGGWTLGSGNGEELFASAKIIALTPEQQAIVEEVSENVYRPCCDNPISFPDCNHGMAALALAELMASQGSGREEIYKALLVANSYWFTGSYVKIAAYMEDKGAAWEDANAMEVLGKNYSSASGNSKISKSIKEKLVFNLPSFTCGA